MSPREQLDRDIHCAAYGHAYDDDGWCMRCSYTERNCPACANTGTVERIVRDSAGELVVVSRCRDAFHTAKEVRRG